MKPRRTRRAPLHLLLASATLAALAACSSPPKEQMAVSRAAVDRVSGPTAAEAPAEVAAAREKLARAQRAMAEKDYVLARQLAQEAEADAALAEARARARRADSALDEVRESLRVLRAELARGS